LCTVAWAEDAGNGPGAARCVLHDGGVHLLLAVVGDDCATSGVEQWLFLKRADRRGDGFESRPAIPQDRLAGFECGAETRVIRASSFGLIFDFRIVPAPPWMARA